MVVRRKLPNKSHMPVRAGDGKPEEARQPRLVEIGLEFCRNLCRQAGPQGKAADKTFRDSLYDND